MGIINRVKEVVRALRFSGSPRLYGRYSAGAGEGEEIRIGGGLQIVGNYLIATGIDYAPRAVGLLYGTGSKAVVPLDANTPIFNGKPRYMQTSTRYVRWSGTFWEVRNGGTAIFRSDEDVYSPDLVSAGGWYQTSGTATTVEVVSSDVVTFKSITAAGGLPVAIDQNTTSDRTANLSLNTLKVGEALTTSGLHSVAIGFRCEASGGFSIAIGFQTTASEEYSFAAGSNTVASGIASFAGGDSTTASGGAAFAIGFTTTASGAFSFAGGINSVASGEGAYAFGVRAKAIHPGASVESDSQDVDAESTAINEKTFRFQNGYRFLGGLATFEGGISGVRGPYSNDAAAAAAGVLIEELYYHPDGRVYVRKV
jgi:hypothetical protein